MLDSFNKIEGIRGTSSSLLPPYDYTDNCLSVSVKNLA